MNASHRNRRGAALLGSLILLVCVLMLVLPVLDALIRQNGRSTVKFQNRKVAFHLASAGLDRALWKLKETNENWQHIAATGPLSGYAGEVSYADFDRVSGWYRVAISSTADPDVLTVVSTGKSKKGEQVSLQALARRSGLGGPLFAYDLRIASATSNLRVHWGPIYNYGDLALTTLFTNQLYPRKLASGAILASSGAYASRDEAPDAPNTDGLEYWSHQALPAFPAPDLEYYRRVAAAAGNYVHGNLALESPQDAQPVVRFIDGNLSLTGEGKFLWGVTIVTGNCSLNGANTSGPGAYEASPPAQAWKEYQRNVPIRWNKTGAEAFGDTDAPGEYPGDAGMAATVPWTFSTPMAGVGRQRVSLRGILYCGKKFAGASSAVNAQVIHGALILREGAPLQGHVEIFYDDSLRLVTTAQNIALDEWREIAAAPF